MSAQTASPPRTPLQERSATQNNSLAIRIVPYSPPRPGDDSSFLPSSRRPSDKFDGRVPPRSRGPASSTHSDRQHSRNSSLHQHTRQHALLSSKDHPDTEWGSVLSAHTGPVLPLDSAKGEVVSGSIGSEPSVGEAPTTPAFPSHLQPSNAHPIHARRREVDQEYCAAADSSGASSDQPRPLSRRRKFVTVHSDKTFSLVSRSDSSDQTSRIISPPLSYSTTSVSSNDFTDDADPASSPLTTLQERSFGSISPCSLDSQPSDAPGEFGSTLSPLNYRLRGGLRKVPKSPDLKENRGARYPTTPSRRPSASTSAQSPPPSETDYPAVSQSISRPLAGKSSFNSSDSVSTISDSANYKVYDTSSPFHSDNISLPPSSPGANSNYRILSQSSPAPSVYQDRPRSRASEENYVVLGNSSPVSSASVVAVRKPVHPQYSQESLVVPPLRPTKRTAADSLKFPQSRSRESLRRVGSIASITTILNQEATQAILSSTSLFLQGGPSPFPTVFQDTYSIPSNKNNNTAGSSRPQMITHPHQWSSQLSTVASESEGEGGVTSRPVSGSLSSFPGSAGSGQLSSHSRNIPSVGSSILPFEERLTAHARSRSDTLERPGPSQPRQTHREAHLIRHHDEHGDGLADLQALQHRPSRTRLANFFNMSSDRNLHSSASSRANSISSSIPAWARVYYGSGERKFLTPSSESMFSEYTESRPRSSFQSGSPSIEHLPHNIYNQRRRPRDHNHRPSPSDPMTISTMPSGPGYGLGRGLKKQTSSVWSPHLQQDKRASRYSVWEPLDQTPDGSFFGRKNMQVVLFVTGFVFPFAWMIASFLPLPPRPEPFKSLEDGASQEHNELQSSAASRRLAILQEAYFDSARWWRQLNRCMAVLGLLVVGAIIALIVVGLREGWGTQNA